MQPMAGAAAEWAAAQVAEVRDHPRGRMALLSRTYHGPVGRAPRHLPFRRAAVSFMHWQIERGVLNPPDADPPGSRWWRKVNDRLLLDGCEAMARSGGLRGEPSSPAIDLWSAFISAPTPWSWYRAHNASIVSAYLDNRALAELEPAAERFFLNVVLLRVLYAHALVAAPRLSLGRFAVLGRAVGDPRLGMAGIFLSLGRVLPDRYPPDENLRDYLVTEHGLGRFLDYDVIQPRLRELYEWSALELGLPGLRDLIRDGSPIYAWPYEERHVWVSGRASLPVRVLRRATSPR
ncbi:hypothetical protein [Parafrankia discariae]|uniref:hypothetical protein n=1 Tax=Parafrankia discariae TaxID=365528 RepID=UPI000379D24B|nr:hypothetical protein [Parafrankia discariae]